MTRAFFAFPLALAACTTQVEAPDLPDGPPSPGTPSTRGEIFAVIPMNDGEAYACANGDFFILDAGITGGTLGTSGRTTVPVSVMQVGIYAGGGYEIYTNQGEAEYVGPRGRTMCRVVA